jgi:hypothetical protein
MAFSSTVSQRGCLALASGNTKPLRLSSVLNLIHRFQCGDERDKLYGILSLVDWSYSTEPVPNYKQSTLRLAIKVLHLILKKEASSPAGGLRMSVSDWAQQLTTVFNLMAAETSRRKARTKRNNSGSKFPSAPKLPDRDLFRGMEFCFAVRIYEPGHKSEHYARIHYSEHGDLNSMVTLVDDQGIPFAHASPGTRANDWFLGLKLCSQLGRTIGLIVRRYLGLSSYYTITGAAIHSGFHNTIFTHSCLNHQYFDVFWDPEDVILLHLELTRHKNLNIGNFLATRVCRLWDSSFAQRVFSRAHTKMSSFDRAKFNELDRWTTSEVGQSTLHDTGESMPDEEADMYLQAKLKGKPFDTSRWYNEAALQKYYTTCEATSKATHSAPQEAHD